MSKNYDMGLLNHPVTMESMSPKQAVECINQGPYGGMIIDYSKSSKKPKNKD